MFTCLEVAEYYQMSALRCEAELSGIVAAVVEAAAVRARSYIGHQQNDQFFGWQPLSTATIFGFHHPEAGWRPGKADLGYGNPPDYAPLLREGDLQDSISAEAEGLVGMVGSTSKIALYQEMGTPGAEYPIPPRPFLAKGLMEAAYEIEGLAGDVAVGLLMPKA
jgi:hypothetical protein